MSQTTSLKSRRTPLLAAGIIGCVLGVALTALALSRGAGVAAPAYAHSLAPESQKYIVAAIKKVGPAVVNINTVVQPDNSSVPPELRQFFGQPMPQEGQASGVIIDRRGYVLTNNHVVQGARVIKVTLADTRTFTATLVGTDPQSEVAVLRIKGDHLPVAELGTSEDKPIGAWVIAIGNPFGYENSVTVGVLSARNRTLSTPAGVVLEHLLQTDAAINPGNSGGALVDIEGKVIGVPTAIIPFAQGIGFAISAETARKFADQIIATGRASHAWLGIAYGPVTEEAQQELKLPNRKGAMIAQVVPGGPAERAGLKPGDVTVRVNGREVMAPDTVGQTVRGSEVGDMLTLVVRRAGKELTVRVKLGQRPMNRAG